MIYFFPYNIPMKRYIPKPVKNNFLIQKLSANFFTKNYSSYHRIQSYIHSHMINIKLASNGLEGYPYYPLCYLWPLHCDSSHSGGINNYNSVCFGVNNPRGLNSQTQTISCHNSPGAVFQLILFIKTPWHISNLKTWRDDVRSGRLFPSSHVLQQARIPLNLLWHYPTLRQ